MSVLHSARTGPSIRRKATASSRRVIVVIKYAFSASSDSFSLRSRAWSRSSRTEGATRLCKERQGSCWICSPSAIMSAPIRRLQYHFQHTQLRQMQRHAEQVGPRSLWSAECLAACSSAAKRALRYVIALAPAGSAGDLLPYPMTLADEVAQVLP